jgi:hypothetical protein
MGLPVFPPALQGIATNNFGQGPTIALILGLCRAIPLPRQNDHHLNRF